MIKSKNIIILIMFTLIISLGIQTLSASSIESDDGYMGSEDSYLKDTCNSSDLRDAKDLDMYKSENNLNNQINTVNYQQEVDKNINIKRSTARLNSDKAVDYSYDGINHIKNLHEESSLNYPDVSGSVKNLKSNTQKELISIQTDDLTCYVNDCVLINVIFNSSNINEGVLIFYVDDDVIATHNLSHSDNSLVFDTYGYEVGVHDIYIEYTASLIYESTDTHACLEIKKHPVYIDNYNNQFTDDNDIKITFDLLSDEQYVTDAHISLYHDDELIKAVELNDSTNSIIIPSIYNSEVIKFIYEGDEYYDALEDYQLVNIDKRYISIYTPSITAYYGQTADVVVSVNNDTKIVDGKIELYVDDLLVYRDTLSSDKCEIALNLTNYPEGVYELKVIYTDSDVFSDASYISSLKVNKIKTVVYTNNITSYKFAEVVLKASVYNYVDDTDEGLIEFFLDDESIQTGQIRNITADYEYIIPDTLTYGVHNLKIIYYGSDKYASSQANAILTVNKYKTTIYIKNTTIDDDGLINVNLNLYSYNQSVNDGKVECYINGQLVKVVDVSNDTAKIVLPENYTPDTRYDIQLVYTGSDYFNDSTYTGSIQQNKTNTTISISKYLSNKNILNITTYVYAKDYSNISEGSVKIYLNNTLIDTCMIINNTANTSYDMSDYPTGNYTLHAEYLESKKYQASSNTTSVEKIITPKTIYINTPSSIKTTPEDTVIIKANLTDYESNLITDKIDAKIIINNQTINTTFTNGVMEVTLTSPEKTGKYNIEIMTINTTAYKIAKRNITLNVNRNNTYISAPRTIASVKLEDVLINLTLNDNNGLVLIRTPVQIKIDNKTIYQGFINNGSLQYKMNLNSSYTQNQYNITVIAAQTKTYSSSSKVITLNLQNRKTYIKSENIYSKKGEQLIFKAQLYDSITHKLVNKSIPMVIKLNDLTILTTNTTNGQLIATYPNNYNNQNYSITIKSATTGIYESSQWNGTLTNNRQHIKVSANNIYANANSTITIKATIYKNNKLTTDNVPVAIKINNLTIATMNITDSHIEYQYKLPDNLSQKEYNITIVTGDTHNLYESTTAFKLFVVKNYQQINTESITAENNQMINIKANITDKNGNIVKSNSLVNIKIAGITIANVNAVDGIVEYNHTLSNIKAGYYDLILKTGETNCYLHATTQKVLKVVD